MTFEDLSKQLNTSVQSLQNLVQVLSAAFDDMEGGSPPHVYDGNEKLVGVWVHDDISEDVYEKTITGTSSSDNTTPKNISVPNVNKMISLDGVLYCDNSVSLPLYYQDNTNMFKGYFINDTIELWTLGSITYSRPFNVTIRYTKTAS